MDSGMGRHTDNLSALNFRYIDTNRNIMTGPKNCGWWRAKRLQAIILGMAGGQSRGSCHWESVHIGEDCW